MKHEVQKIVDKIEINIVEDIEQARTMLESASKKVYTCIITGKLTKTGDSKYYAVCTFKEQLQDAEKSLLARLYLETVVLHSAIRDRLIDKTESTPTDKQKGTF